MTQPRASQAVAILVLQMGEATADDLQPLLPYLSRQQILMALKNAKAAKLITVKKRGGGIPGFGSKPSIWGPWEDEEDDDLRAEPFDMTNWVRPANSVFELGDRAGAMA